MRAGLKWARHPIPPCPRFLRQDKLDARFLLFFMLPRTGSLRCELILQYKLHAHFVSRSRQRVPTSFPCFVDLLLSRARPTDDQPSYCAVRSSFSPAPSPSLFHPRALDSSDPRHSFIFLPCPNSHAWSSITVHKSTQNSWSAQSGQSYHNCNVQVSHVHSIFRHHHVCQEKLSSTEGQRY